MHSEAADSCCNIIPYNENWTGDEKTIHSLLDSLNVKQINVRQMNFMKEKEVTQVSPKLRLEFNKKK